MPDFFATVSSFPGFSAILPLYSPFASLFLQSQFSPRNSGSRVPKSGSLPVVVNTPTAWAVNKLCLHPRPFPLHSPEDASWKDPWGRRVSTRRLHTLRPVGRRRRRPPPLEICGGRNAPAERFRLGLQARNPTPYLLPGPVARSSSKVTISSGRNPKRSTRSVLTSRTSLREPLSCRWGPNWG